LAPFEFLSSFLDDLYKKMKQKNTLALPALFQLKMPQQLLEIIISIFPLPFKGRVRVGMGLAFSPPSVTEHRHERFISIPMPL